MGGRVGRTDLVSFVALDSVALSITVLILGSVVPLLSPTHIEALVRSCAEAREMPTCADRGIARGCRSCQMNWPLLERIYPQSYQLPLDERP